MIFFFKIAPNSWNFQIINEKPPQIIFLPKSSAHLLILLYLNIQFGLA